MKKKKKLRERERAFLCGKTKYRMRENCEFIVRK